MSPCPVREVALELGLKTLTPEKVGADESVAELSELEADLFVVVAYGQYIPKKVLSLAKYRA